MTALSSRGSGEGERKPMSHHRQRRHVVLRLVPLAAALSLAVACDYLPGFGTPGPEVVEEAATVLKSGDLPQAATDYAALAVEHEGSVHVAVGQAYTQLLAGDTAGADATLARIEEASGEQLGEIKLRRALVALAAGELDAVKEHGLASEMPEGRLLAAEVLLVDLESDEASAVLRDLTADGGTVGQTAQTYLDMLDTDDIIQAGLAEATALWALGERKQACESAEELVLALPEDDTDKPTQILLWAGRAATSGVAGVATRLLDELSFPPPDQAWRVQATRAVVAAADGDADEAARILNALEEGGAPIDGLADARATACAVVGDRQKARQIVGEMESPAIARCLSEVGATLIAPKKAPDGALKTYLENQ